ncbi:MAG TPA: SRPBCC family protein, partial [Thermoanaerobaculia bacterium]|nr:SRPBCC family protein [Thermoanaerobaculia bacterium]
MRDAVATRPSQPSTGPAHEAALPSYTSYTAPPEHESLAAIVGSAALVFGGAALFAYAARERNWKALGVAVAGVPLAFRGATGHWVPRALVRESPQEIPEAVEAAAPFKVHASLTVNQPADELYRFWRQLENLPRFMKNLDSVTEEGGISHWVGKSPLGLKVTWDAKIVDDQPGRVISWRSLADSEVDNSGWVRFEPATGNRGTVVRVHMDVRTPENLLGRALARLTHKGVELEVQQDLRRFKALMETGEVPTTEGQPAGD